MKIKDCHKAVLAHARILGYSRHEVVDDCYWVFYAEFGRAIVYYLPPPGTEMTPEEIYRSARMALTRHYNKGREVKYCPKKSRPKIRRSGATKVQKATPPVGGDN